MGLDHWPSRSSSSLLPTDFSVTTRGGIVVVAGDVDMLTAPALRAALCPLVEAGGHVRLNARSVTFFGSSGLHVVADAATRLGTRGRIVVLNPSAIVLRVIELFGFRDRLDVVCAPGTLRSTRSSLGTSGRAAPPRRAKASRWCDDARPGR
jgi:anti-sigma B factor antagonist